jgi:hypothetical protein
MPTLLFNHEGWECLSSSWTAATNVPDRVTICYQWGANWGSWYQGATGIRQIRLEIRMQEFVSRVQRGGIIDLRDCAEA